MKFMFQANILLWGKCVCQRSAPAETIYLFLSLSGIVFIPLTRPSAKGAGGITWIANHGAAHATFSVQAQPCDYWNTEDPTGSGHIQHPFLFFHCVGWWNISQLEDEGTSLCGKVGFCLGEGQKNAKNNLGSHQHPCLGLIALTPTDTSVFAPFEAPAWDLQEIKLSQQPFISSCGLCRAALQSLGGSLRGLLPLLSRASFPAMEKAPDVEVQPHFGVRLPQPSEHPLRPPAAPLFVLFVSPGSPKGSPSLVWFGLREDGWEFHLLSKTGQAGSVFFLM